MDDINPWWLAGIAAMAILIAGAVWMRRFGLAVQVERARELFRLQHERYEEILLAAAAATGKPRGLRWLSASITGNAKLARNAARKIVALVPVIVRFEPVEGSDMENVPMAKQPRVATALFSFHRGEWHTDGRIVFNLDPEQAVKHFGLQNV
ncbi:MAG: hypothetical protein U0791_27700 [Gemmataceae bacterium]